MNTFDDLTFIINFNFVAAVTFFTGDCHLKSNSFIPRPYLPAGKKTEKNVIKTRTLLIIKNLDFHI